MSGFWYTAAIATTASALFAIATGVGVPLGDNPSRRATFEALSYRLITSKQLPSRQPTFALTGSTAGSRTASQRVSRAIDRSADLISGVKISGVEEETASRREVASKNADRANYEQAVAIARLAVDAYQSAQSAETPAKSIAFTRREKRLWRRSIQKLSAIPRSAVLYPQANDKKAHYTTLLTTAERKVLAADSAFLADIISDAGLSADKMHITLCQIDVPPESIGTSGLEAKGGFNPDHCRHYQGEQLLASPASLIKLPIAIALLDKVDTESLDLNSKLYIDPDNFTENAIGATIEVDKEYPLVQVMGRMIDESNNIATNQLIDYVGRDNIAKTLAEQGYQDTFVDHKLAGDRILPPNPGTQSNRITTDDITMMMVNIYRLSHPGDEELLEALLGQKDQELGYQALQELQSELKVELQSETSSKEDSSEENSSEEDSSEEGRKESASKVEWMGEKTGQNNRMLGTTLAMKIADNRYALTVAIDYGGDPIAIREIVKGIALYLIKSGPLVATVDPTST
ncbi:MAG: serine hydrolase [Cyanobacteria bacterium P01_D01_bin.1]